MRTRLSLAVCLGLLAAGCGDSGDVRQAAAPTMCMASGDTPLSLQSTDFKLQEVTSTAGLPGPMDLQAPAGDARLFVAERAGLICVVQSGMLLPTPFLNISSRVYTEGEAGLLSFAFDPQYSTNGFVYVHFVENIPGTTGDIVVERYQVSSDPNVLQTPGTGVIRIPHREANNHYGGRVMFGPDGMLYLSAGDGGGGNNQFGHAQDAASHLGKILRIDVSTLPYVIPADNPVWPSIGQRNENWAIGLRNPFRPAFDNPTGQLYIADVGQSAREEVDVVDASAAGLNYGWSVMEGTQCFGASTCDMTGLTLPVYDYDHSQDCAIIGGYVYRGAAIPGLQGKYLFSDLCRGVIRSLSIDHGVATVTEAPMVNVGTPISFGRDGFGEVYVLTADNHVLQFVRP